MTARRLKAKPEALAARSCAAVYRVTTEGITRVCQLRKGHDGDHEGPAAVGTRVQVANSAETHAAIAAGKEPGALARIMASPGPVRAEPSNEALIRHEHMTRAYERMVEAQSAMNIAHQELRDALGSHAATTAVLEAATATARAKVIAFKTMEATRRAIFR